MALSDVIKRIEDSPRSTKVAAGVAGVAVASAIAVFVVMNNQPEYRPAPEPAAKAAVTSTQTVPSPASLQPAPTPVPTKTPPPDLTKTPEPSPTVEKPTPNPTAKPTEIPTPAATPTPETNDYYVDLHRGGVLGDDRGTITFHASYPFKKTFRGGFSFNRESFYLEYLRKEGVITSEQKKAYFNGDFIRVPLVSISNATYKVYQTQGYNLGLHEDDERYLFHYADKSLDYGESVSNAEGLLAGSDQGYVMISDGKISVATVDGDGNTTTVQFEGVGAKELLDYWLSQNKITVQQRNAYGQTGEIQFSLKDGVDLFDFGSALDGGSSFGLDKETQDKIVNEILPLFKIGD